MSSFVNKMKKQKSSSSQANAPLSTQYCPFFDTQPSNDENEFARKHSKYAVNTAATSATSMVLQSVKNKVNSCKQFQQTIAKEVKQKLKFTVDQITSKFTKKSAYTGFNGQFDSPMNSPMKAPGKMSLQLDNPCYYTPSKPSATEQTPGHQRKLRRKRKPADDVASTSSAENGGTTMSAATVTSVLKELKRSRRSMRKVIKKQDKKETAANVTTRRRSIKRLQMPTLATPTPAKMARTARSACSSSSAAAAVVTPARRKKQLASRYLNPQATPISIFDAATNQKKVVRRRSSRICSLLKYTNPIAYQLKG